MDVAVAVGVPVAEVFVAATLNKAIMKSSLPSTKLSGVMLIDLTASVTAEGVKVCIEGPANVGFFQSISNVFCTGLPPVSVFTAV